MLWDIATVAGCKCFVHALVGSWCLDTGQEQGLGRVWRGGREVVVHGRGHVKVTGIAGPIHIWNWCESRRRLGFEKGLERGESRLPLQLIRALAP
jgi:hypothetical protein